MILKIKMMLELIIRLTIPKEIASATVKVPSSMKFIGTLVLRVLTHIIGIITTRATPQQT